MQQPFSLCKAAILGDRDLVLDLFSKSLGHANHAYQHFLNPDVRKTVVNRQVSILAPMELARSNGHFLVREDLLMEIDINKSLGCVDWHELRLTNIEIPWLQKIAWVKRLRLDKNGLTMLPVNIGHYLKQVLVYSL